MDGFPIPSSLRVTGFDKSLTSFGVERGRLPQMYRVGEDTSAIYILLIHAASKLSLDGIGISVLPLYIAEEHKAFFVEDLHKKARVVVERKMMSDVDLRAFSERLQLPLMGILLAE